MPHDSQLPELARNVTDAHYRRVVESVSDYAIFMLDPEGRICTWNRGAERMKGYTTGQALGRHFEMFYPADAVVAGLPRRWLATARDAGRAEDEGWRVRRDGSRFWANVVITRLLDDAGQLEGFSKVTRDLTQRHEHEELLRQSEELFRLLVNGVRDYAIFMLDPDGRVVSWNLGAQVNKGYAAEEIIGRHFSLFYPPEQVEARWPELELRLAMRDGQFEDEGWRVRKDGSRFWANVTITALHDAEGRHRGFAKVTRDMTVHRRVHALEGQGRNLQRFIATLGHELRNPLASIANAASVLQTAGPGDPAPEQARAVLVRQVAHLRRLVDDLLDVGRITSGNVHLDRRPVRLQDVVERTLDAMAPEIERHGLHVGRSLARRPLWVLGDEVRLSQVVTNLVHNACKFTPKGGHVRVRLHASGDMATLSVSDDGCGIPPRDLERVFELFAQGSTGDAVRHDGLGIGLNLVQEIVSRHGGRVSAASTGVPGEGAEFVVRLPLVDPPPGDAPCDPVDAQ